MCLEVGTEEKFQIMNQASTNGEERTISNIGIILYHPKSK